MQIRVLGPVEATVDDRPVALGGAKQRAVLAILGLEADRPVTADRLIEGLWGETPPASAAKMLQNYVMRLRKALAEDAGAEIVTRGRAYELRIDRERVDACRLERLVAEAARAAEAGAASGAAREALALFRGDPLADVADEPFAGQEIRRLADLRLTAAELAIDADLAAGHDRDLVGEVDALLAKNPLRERLHAMRMLALYRAGRQAEALEAYRVARVALVEELGIEPTPALRELNDAILRQDPTLLVEPTRPELPAELDPSAAPPLIGRDAELHRLRARWARGEQGVVIVVGEYGAGKTRLAAELAAGVHREGAAVVYAAGVGAPEAALAAIARLRVSSRRALLVLDDADRAPGAVCAAAHRVRGLVLATGLQAAALARLEPAESIALAPLGADGVREIAGFYAPAGREVPVETLRAASGGVPRRVHEAAAEWARQEAIRRVDETAARAAASRSETRALQRELADSVAELQSTRERGAREDAEAPVVCPYKGLATFGTDDADYFFGRERLVAELVARLAGASLLAVVGPSGSGKSSVVRAGLLPALAGGALPGSQTWMPAVIRPGEHPLRELRRATRRLEREWRGVLVVDQFEELFTAPGEEAERARFAAALVRAARDGGPVVLALRADFFGRCAAYPELAALIGANTVLVGPMARDELARAIERPARRAGLSVEPELVEALLTDVEGRPGALPLLSTALLELWRERDGRLLRRAAYARSGGVQGAVARLAEDAFLALDAPQQAAARALLLRLTDEDDSGALVRRRLALGEVDAELAGALADRRLLTVDEDTVEVAHEALLREWPRLRGWLEEDVQGRRLHRRLGAAADAWQGGDGELYRGAHLAAALDWAAGHPDELDAAERVFLAASRTASMRAQRRLRLTLAGVAGLLVIAVFAGAVALDERESARATARTARAEATASAAQRLGAQALAADDLDLGLLLARQGVALSDSPQTRSNLLAMLLRSPAVIRVLVANARPLTSLALSPDGHTLAVTDADGALRLYDTRTGRSVARPHVLPNLAFSAAPGARPFGDYVTFSDDGRLLAAGEQPIAVMDAHTHRLLGHADLHDRAAYAYRLRFAPGGRALLVAMGGPALGVPKIVRIQWRSGDLVERYVGHPAAAVSLMPASGGRVLTSDADATAVRDARTLRVLRRYPVGAIRAALSPDGRTLLAGAGDGSVRFLDLVSGAVRMGAGRHDGAVVRAAFSADGRTAVTAGEDNRLLVWDARRAAVTETLSGHAGRITGLAISPDGRTLYTGALDGRVLVWDLAGDRRLARAFATGRGDAVPVPQGAPSWPLLHRPPLSYALRHDGRVLATGEGDGTVTLTDPRTLRRVGRLRAVPHGPVRGLGYVPHTPFLVAGGDAGYLAELDPGSGKLVRLLPGQRGTMLAPSFSADGRVMATVGAGDSVRLWRMRAGRPAGPPRTYIQPQETAGPAGAAVSPDGRRVAIASALGVEIVDVATLRRLRWLPNAGTIKALVGFTPDGRLLVGGSTGGWVRLWSTRTWRPASRVLSGGTEEVVAQSVSPDGHTLATGSPDGTVRLYDLRSSQPLGRPLPALPGHPAAPVFTPDGAFLLEISDAGRAYRWNVRPSAWGARACAIAGRTLSRAEWAQLLPEHPYTPACETPRLHR